MQIMFNNIVYKLTLIALCLVSALSSFSTLPEDYFYKGQKNKACRHWVDSVYEQLTVNERIAQCFMLPAYTAGKDYNMDTVLRLVRDGKAGGVIFFKGCSNSKSAMSHEPLVKLSK